MSTFDYMAWIVIPILIFLARLVDVSLATLRHILVFRGMRKIVPVFAFFEIIVWLLAIAQVMSNLNNIACFLAYAFGFSAGTYFGMVIEEKLALGHQLVRVILQGESTELRDILKRESFGNTSMSAHGAHGAVNIVFIVSQRKRLGHLMELLNQIDPKPFYTVEDVRTVGKNADLHPLISAEMAMDGSAKRK